MGRNTHTQLMECQAELAREREARDGLGLALEALLDWAERAKAGFEPESEHWYIARDTARIALSKAVALVGLPERDRRLTQR